jgi:tellurite resistance protein TerC
VGVSLFLWLRGSDPEKETVMTAETLGIWVGFNLFVLALLALDLGVFHRRPHAISLKEAWLWSGVWVGVALAFNVGLYFSWESLFPESSYSAGEAGLAFLTGYLIEKSLSVDNLFVIAVIFTAFGVPRAYQHRVLFWGILGALVMRGTMIGAGTVLLHQFHWIIYIFGGFLLFTGLKMLLTKEREVDPRDSRVVRAMRRILPITEGYHGQHFFVREAGKLAATPLLVVLALVEATDMVFAVDSIPAIFAVTKDPFLVYTSNVFAILGLRSLYFVLSGMMGRFRYLKPALAMILIFVGAKMALVEVYNVPAACSLAVVIFILATALVASLMDERRRRRPDSEQNRDAPHKPA